MTAAISPSSSLTGTWSSSSKSPRTATKKLIYLRPDEVDLYKGTPIRILGGPFNGIEGTFIKLRGHRNRRVVVMLKGIVGVAMAEVTPDLIEVLEK